MAKHRVVMNLPPREIKRADVSFKIKRDGKLLGTLEVSNGSIVWYPSGTTYGNKMNWAKFDKMMDSEASRFEIR
jgi:phage pi2 protein 07